MKRFQLLFIKLLPYLSGSALLLALMIFGSGAKTENPNSPIASNFSDVNFRVTADQVSESYVVASIADTLMLPSASTSGENYITISNHYEETGTISTQANNNINEKPIQIDIGAVSRGVIKYTVAEGDTLASISDEYGVSKDHLRWSNDLKDETIEVGKELLIPSVDGIVYKAKSDDTVDSLADKYGSNKEEIIAYNDLEVDNTLKVDSYYVLPGGDLPEKERPEYVPPAPTPTYSNPGYTYYANGSGGRQNIFEVGSYGYWASIYNYRDNAGVMDPGAFGNCTWFAWYWRNHSVDTGALPESYRLPGGAIGNARDWAYSLGSRGFAVNNTPAYGAVIQSMAGYYGHVGVVVGVDEGNSVTIQEMNYAGPNGMFNHVYQSTISWSDAMGYNYIHGR